ncbi:ABC transporter ATP-binding protein [Paenarthrobacter sp. NPDC089989]|uniref:ABC transporter ATP-binding protein n=1 Tax=unclassified Paenarthrobacter TaxID=2634190 RepID=UPI00382CEAE1
MTSDVIWADRVSKAYGSTIAVEDLSFSVKKGESFGLLGPNGAGKSTTMRLLSAVSPRTGGQFEIFGLDPDQFGPTIRGRLGVVPQHDNLDVDLKVRDNLQVYGRYFGLSRREVVSRTDELLRFAELSDRANNNLNELSGGMRRRLTIARALINKPEVLLLDEPTTGLDPQARHILWDRLIRLKEDGTTLILTSHYMEEAEQLCDRLIVIDKGRIMAEGSPSGLIAKYSSREVLELRFGVTRNSDAARTLAELGQRTEVLPDRILIYCDDAEEALKTVSARGLSPNSAITRRSTLEDVFLRLAGRSLSE